ncbi:uncharacterized protein MYCFIDRAFT_214021 [Pseudocercospora fijiensis CIRAD86]|uniref:Uncharacterized protein n=1 Tax=Pseudocercospora fijiensis (strain CIRAD86) TaxID=383855 RepID=M3A411_PSEFD|nr:uncharacterized protein MYCFIDRAFT_214021 [Pseudocercospora fijiensis CIRAD86]EME85839.1 hypothetical protein MYCFIDRAFT_214021 [Pseudocercospora fijiensis CIRAD86]
MANDGCSLTSSGRKLRRSPSSRDQTIRAVYDSDQSASLSAQHTQRNAQQQLSSPPTQRVQYLGSAGSMPASQQHTSPSQRASHTSQIPAPTSSGRANVRIHGCGPPPYQASPSAWRPDDEMGTESNMMDCEQSQNDLVAARNHDSQPFQSSHLYAQQENDNRRHFNPIRLYATEVRPAASFAFDMTPVPRPQLHDQVSNLGGCTCADRNCPLIHYDGPESVSAKDYHYEVVPNTARYVSTAELTAAYLNPHADPYAASRAPREFEQDWHAKEQYTRPFLYDADRARGARSLSGGPGGSRDRRRPEQRHAHERGADTSRTTDFSEPRSPQRSTTIHRVGSRAPPGQNPDCLEERDVAMMEVRSPGRLGVQIIEAAGKWRYGEGGA